MEKTKMNGSKSNEMEEISGDVNVNGNNASVDNSKAQSGANGAADAQSEVKLCKALKEILCTDDMKFMNNFDPESSNREKRKLNRKLNNNNNEGKKHASLYDENGILKCNGKDLCDCLNEDCPGCHFPCPKCTSCKCGQECRVNRRWMYESVESEEDELLRKNSSSAT